MTKRSTCIPPLVNEIQSKLWAEREQPHNRRPVVSVFSAFSDTIAAPLRARQVKEADAETCPFELLFLARLPDWNFYTTDRRKKLFRRSSFSAGQSNPALVWHKIAIPPEKQIECFAFTRLDFSKNAAEEACQRLLEATSRMKSHHTKQGHCLICLLPQVKLFMEHRTLLLFKARKHRKERENMCEPHAKNRAPWTVRTLSTHGWLHPSCPSK